MGDSLSANRRTGRCYAIMISSIWKPSPGKKGGQHGNCYVDRARRRDIGAAVSLFLSCVRRCAPIEAKGEMPGTNIVSATITRESNGSYTLTVCIVEGGRSRVLIERTAASIVDAERAAEEFTSRHGAP